MYILLYIYIYIIFINTAGIVLKQLFDVRESFSYRFNSSFNYRLFNAQADLIYSAT